MRGKTSDHAKIRILTVSALFLAIFNVLLWRETLSDAAPAVVQESVAAAPPAPVIVAEPSPKKSIGVPMRISIPSIDVDAAIEKVAMAKDGSMDVPKHPDDTAWFEPGPRPGEMGSAAIAGHVDWKNGATAVFADLHKVKTGDRIDVLDDTGAVISFVVRGARRYGATENATDVFSSRDAKAHLNLITCTGAWDKAAKQYAERLVVFTDRVTE